MKNVMNSASAEAKKSNRGLMLVKSWLSRCYVLIPLLLLGTEQMWADHEVFVDWNGQKPDWYTSAEIHYWDGSENHYVSLSSTSTSNVEKASIADNATGWRVTRRSNGNRCNGGAWLGSSTNMFKVTAVNTQPESNGDGPTGEESTIVGLVESGAYMYFDNSVTGWTGVIQFVVGRDAYSKTYTMSQITGTKFWYVQFADTWKDATYYGFISSGSKFNDGSWGSSNLANATGYTAIYTSNYSLYNGNTYVCTPSAAANGSAVTITYESSGYNAIASTYTHNLYVYTRTQLDGSTPSYGTSLNSPTTVNIKGYEMTGNGATTQRTSSVTTSSKSTTRGSIISTSTVSSDFSALDANSAWTFDGWAENTSGPSDANSTYSIENAKAAKSIYAYFSKRTYTVSFNMHGYGSAIDSRTQDYYTLVTQPSDPTTASAFVFRGWWKEGTYENEWNFATDRITATTTIHAKWLAYVNVAYNKGANGIGSNVTDKKVTGENLTLRNALFTRTGYTQTGWTTTDGTAQTHAFGATYSTQTALTLYPAWTAHTYTVHFNGNGNDGGSMSDQTSIAYDAATTLTANAFTKTGYNFAGWATSAEGSAVRADEAAHGNLTSEDGATVDLYATWTPKNYTVTLDPQTSATGYSASGSLSNPTVTYDAALPAISGSVPTAANGYCFMGFYTEAAGAGVKLINADKSWESSVAGYTDESGNWVHDGIVTLYAYYKKAEITALELSPATINPEGTVTATPTISPAPAGTTKICWELLLDNDNPYDPQPTFTNAGGNAVSFTAPDEAGTYKVKATLRTGSSCGSGTVLSTITTNLIVAGSHTITIQYKCGSDVIQKAITMTAYPLEWSDVAAPAIFGYSFTGWSAGDGITLTDNDGATTGTSSSSASIKVRASYGGILTANYSKNDYIYFKNTLGWENDNVYVYFYNSSGYWGGSGAGATGANCIGKGKMSLVEGESDILYWDYGANITGGAAAATKYVAFTWGDKTGYANFNDGDAVYPTEGGNQGFSSGTPMFVPLDKSTQSAAYTNGAPYYNKGYWTNYKGETGYWVDIFYSKGGSFDKSVDFVRGSAGMPYTATVNLTAGSQLGFKIVRKGFSSGNIYYYTSTDVTLNNASTAKELSNTNSQTGITPNVSGDYVFTLTCAANGKLNLSIAYPASLNDYRIVYNDRVAWSGDAHTASWYHPSDVIAKNTSDSKIKKDIVSFFVSKAAGASASMKFQYVSAIDNSNITWSDVAGGSIDLSDIDESGVYNFYLSQPAGGASIRVDSIKPYTGNYYIRSVMANSKWDNYTTDGNHLMTYSEYAEAERGFTHYWVKYVSNGSDIRYTVANDYSPCISDTLLADVLSSPVTTTGGSLSTGEEGVNIRSMWNHKTNQLSRAYLTGPVSNQYLLLRSLYQSTASDNRIFKSWTSAESNTRLSHANFTESAVTYDLDTLTFKDMQNWVYQLDVYARPQASYKLTAYVNGNTTFIRGLEGDYTTAANVTTLIGGEASSTTAYHIHMVYDFKSDRMVTAWMPTGEIAENMPINADIMVVREHQNTGQQITFANSEVALTEVKNVYGVMRFNRYTLDNKSTTYPHSPLPAGSQKSPFERCLYWISFPFDVNLSDVFGFGTYGKHWIIEEYDGAKRAKEGFWKDTDSFWTYVTNRTGKVLKAGLGYVLALDLDLMKSDNTEFWANNIEQVELFFPSTTTVSNIKQTTVEVDVPAHECKIDRRSDEDKENNVPNINKDRTVADSHWNLIGVPSYANYGTELKDAENTAITWHSADGDIPFLYEWNSINNRYTVKSGSTYAFQAMHACLVQYTGKLKWTLASATPASSIVARRTYAEKPQFIEMCLEIRQNDKMIDQTFVKLSDDEKVSANFAFDEDMSKDFFGETANIYTLVENYLPVAGNTLPMSEQMTSVPVGVKIATSGNYTFAIPNGTEGIGVTLVDNETGERTSLSALDYTVNLTAGTYDKRFVLEISPIANTPTGIENAAAGNRNSEARKVMIDNTLYIVKDGRMYDARGAKVK